MIPPPYLVAIAVWLVFINVATFAAFAWDKRQARRGGRRFTEAGLIHLAALGGGLGGGLAMALLRHKSNKPPFQRRFWNMFASQVLIVACVLIVWAIWTTD